MKLNLFKRPAGNYTEKRFACKRLATFDARPRVRVYYTRLTGKIIDEKSKEFVCLRYARPTPTVPSCLQIEIVTAQLTGRQPLKAV
jgi:hypothetical protein